MYTQPTSRGEKKRAIKKGERLDADLRASKTEKDNEKKLLKLSASDAAGDVVAGDIGVVGGDDDGGDIGVATGGGDDVAGDDVAGDDAGSDNITYIVTFFIIIMLLVIL